jgi:uncharacterized protein YndB with AHSA1/START domain
MTGRATSKFTVDVNRPPEDVFAYLSDVRRHSEWSPKPYRVEELADGPVGLGSTFVSIGWIPRDPEHRNDVEVTEFDPPSRITLTSREKGQDFINTFVLTPQGGGTRVDRTLDMPKPGGAAGAIFPLFLGGFIKPAVNKGMKMLKANLEGAGTQGG